MAFKQPPGSLEETLAPLFLNAGVKLLLPSVHRRSFLRLDSGKHLFLSVEESKKLEDKCVFLKRNPLPMSVKLLHPGAQGALGLNGRLTAQGRGEAAGCTLSTGASNCGGVGHLTVARRPDVGKELCRAGPGKGCEARGSQPDVRRPLSSPGQGLQVQAVRVPFVL